MIFGAADTDVVDSIKHKNMKNIAIILLILFAFIFSRIQRNLKIWWLWTREDISLQEKIVLQRGGSLCSGRSENEANAADYNCGGRRSECGKHSTEISDLVMTGRENSEKYKIL